MTIAYFKTFKQQLANMHHQGIWECSAVSQKEEGNDSFDP